MRRETAIKENLDLLDTFMKYAFDHPEILDEIPPDAELVILPKGDPELYEANKRLAESLSKEGKKVVVVNLQKPRIPKPKIAHLGA
jgi:hypothetical protein